MTYQIVREDSDSKNGFPAFYVIKKTEHHNLCTFNNTSHHINLERLYYSIDKHFDKHTSEVNTYINHEVLDTFETIKEFREKFAEYLI
jgi:hypothetical protein